MRSWIDRQTATRALGALLLVIAVFTFSRGLLAYSSINFPAESDVETAYADWSYRVVNLDRAPYSEVDIEYPPASLPFTLLPEVLTDSEAGYRTFFVVTMLIVDLIGFLGLLVIGRRRGSLLGPWLWTIALFILGPVVYLRLDLVPAVATLWMVARADRDDWLSAGALLGLAIATKGYALVLVPVALIMCPPRLRKRFLIGLGALLLLPLIPFVPILGSMFENVFGYHSARGIQIESLWGSLLFILRSFDRFILVTHNYGAHHFERGVVPLLKVVASIATVAVTALGAWIAGRSTTSKDDFAGVAFTTITLVVAVASVFSPQFTIWVIALAAATACWPNSRVASQALLLIPLAAVTRAIYPSLHPGLVRAETVPIIVVWFRNLMLLMTGIYAAVRILDPATAPSTPEPVSEGKP